jgi:hypothetical protein
MAVDRISHQLLYTIATIVNPRPASRTTPAHACGRKSGASVTRRLTLLATMQVRLDHGKQLTIAGAGASVT